MSDLDTERLKRVILAGWEGEWDGALFALKNYIHSPNLSPAFDPNWRDPGLNKESFTESALKDLEVWCLRESKAIPGMKAARRQIGDLTPVLFIDIPAFEMEDAPNVLLYGHYDKQPAGKGWREGLEPYKPTRESDRLYGRGSADDGYAIFAAIIAIKALREQGIPHPRCVILIEGSEESGSPHLPPYLDMVAEEVGEIATVIALDSSCATYDRLWVTTSLRGVIMANLTVEVLTESVHSGTAGGIVPSSALIAMKLLQRFEQPGVMSCIQRPPPVEADDQAQTLIRLVGPNCVTKLPWLPALREGLLEATREEHRRLILQNTWGGSVEVTGTDLPALDKAANVTRASTTFRLSMRTGPGVNAEQAAQRLKHLLEEAPPYGATVAFRPVMVVDGWMSPPMTPKFAETVREASKTFFGAPSASLGEGGTIPFMKMLSDRYPKAQVLVTGVLGPESNAHGPNEFLHLPTAYKLTACLSYILSNVTR